jgi:hypothetical protein
MGKLSRNKGVNYEREIARKFSKLFPKARRQLEYHEDDANGVDIQGTGKLKIQCKRGKKYAPITKIREIQPSGIHLLVTKADRERDIVCLYLDDFLAIIEDIGVIYEKEK